MREGGTSGHNLVCKNSLVVVKPFLGGGGGERIYRTL